jgi:hypothetical protein
MPDSNKGLAKKEQFINNLFAYIKLTFPIQGRGRKSLTPPIKLLRVLSTNIMQNLHA